MRKTKIICTLGPAVDEEQKLTSLVKKGFDVARLNFSHGNHQEHKRRIEMLREINSKLGLETAVLIDTKGPEIRTGQVLTPAKLIKGETIILTTEEVEGSKEKVSISYKNLPREVVVSDQILLDDGLISLEVTKIMGEEIYCQVKSSGILGSKKGVNLPKVDIKLPSISEKDKEDIKFAMDNKADFLALSFVRRRSDVEDVRDFLGEQADQIKIIAKIECELAVKNIDEILDIADGVMVARGDLGVEIPLKEVPLVQKNIIQKARQRSKPVIVATQMLDSMERNPRPTRAEVSDIANSILDGTDAVMLSGETAQGLYAIEALTMMDEIARETEKSIQLFEPISFKTLKKSQDAVDLLTYATVDIGRKIGAKVILVPTSSGATAKRVSRHRSSLPIIALVESIRLLRSLKLTWGVESYVVAGDYDDFNDLLEEGSKVLLGRKICKKEDTIVLVAGVPLNEPGTTNTIKVHQLK